MNARALAAWCGACLAIALASDNPVYRGLVLLAAINVLVARRRPERRIGPVLFAAALAGAAAVILNIGLSHTGADVFASIPDSVPGIGGPLTVESAVFGLTAALGIAAALLGAAPLALALESHELVDALPAALERTGTALAAALGFVPAIGRSLTSVSEAQRMRGWRPTSPASWAAVLIPVMLTAIEDSIHLAEAMEARAFASGPRSHFGRSAWRATDSVVTAAAGGALALFAGSRIAGATLDWYPFPRLSLPPVQLVPVIACVLLLAPLLAPNSTAPFAVAAGIRSLPRFRAPRLRLRLPLAAPLAAISIAGIGLFVWPFLGLGLPPETPALALSLAMLAVLAGMEAGIRRLDARRLALLAALAAIDAGLRMAVVTGIGGFSPVFLPVLCAGFVFGPSFGFLAGGFGMLVSALATGGVGPWLPYQVFGVGWVGAAAGLAGMVAPGRGLARVACLALVGVATGFAFGALMDVWDWSGYFRGGGLGWEPGLAPAAAAARFARFYVVTSLVYDSFRSVGNAALILLLGPALLAALGRLKARLSYEVLADPA